MSSLPDIILDKRQGYGAVTGGLQKGAKAIKGSKADQGLSTGQVAGIVFGVIIILALFVATTWLCCVRSARRRDAQRQEALENAPDPGLRRGTSFAHRAITRPGGSASAAVAKADRPLIPLSRQDAASVVPMTEIDRSQQRQHGYDAQSNHDHYHAPSGQYENPFASSLPPPYSLEESYSHHATHNANVPYGGQARHDYGSPFASTADINAAR